MCNWTDGCVEEGVPVWNSLSRVDLVKLGMNLLNDIDIKNRFYNLRMYYIGGCL